MPHIDEGALHAYLDGALDEYPASAAARVRAHLESCGQCREKLEVERDLREHAARILGVAAPDVDAPAFEELRAFQRAHAQRSTGAFPRVTRLGWAASVVLAIGVGWALRGGGEPGSPAGRSERDLLGPTVAAPPTQMESDARVADAEVPRGVAQEAVGTEAGGAGGASAPAAAAADAGLLPSRLDLDPVSVVVATFDDAITRDEVVQVDVEAPPLPAPPVEPRGERMPQLVADAAVNGAQSDAGSHDDAVAEPDRSRTPAEVVTSASRAADRSGIAPFGRGSDEDTREDVLDEDGSYSLVVPNLEVMDVRFRGGVRPEGQVVLQRLEGGDTLEVIHLPPEIDPSSLEEADAEDRELVLQTASGWIVMRAPVDEDRLVELMRRLLDED